MNIWFCVVYNGNRIYFPYTSSGYGKAMNYCEVHNLPQKEPFIRPF